MKQPRGTEKESKYAATIDDIEDSQNQQVVLLIFSSNL